MRLKRASCGVVALLASVLVGRAQGADLPARPAVAVDYVQVCSTHGVGYFAIPGTETCLRIGGRVRVEYRYLEPGNRASDAISTRARGRIELDARTATAYGALRTFVRYEVTRNTGSYGSNTFNLDRAFVQFGGLTAGRTQSYFDFYTNDYNFGAILVSDFNTQVLAYSAKFGSGWTASVALEDGIERRFLRNPNGPDFPGEAFAPPGLRMPDVVGQLLVDQSWGKAQASAALHQIRSDNLRPGLVPDFSGTEYGFAVQGGVQIKLPAIADGDQLWLQGAYTRGALSYLGFGNTDVGNLGLTQTDAYVDALGQTKLSEGWAANALFLHYWTPGIRQAAFVSYGIIDYPGAASFVTPAGGRLGFVGLTDWRVGTNLSWLPTRGFYIGIEGLYRSVDPKGRVPVDNDPAALRLIGRENAMEARLRVQRDF